MEPHSNTELIVSIDFGSSFTKVQHTISMSQVVADYQPPVRSCTFEHHSGVGRSTTVPSVIQYGRSGDIVGWGFDPIVEGAVEIKGIKLCLPHEDDRMFDPITYPVIAHAIQRRNDLGKTVLTVLTDFMTRLWQVCKPQIIEDELDVSWRLIITHPVGWNTDKLEQAIDTAIVMPDQGNSTYTICFQTEAEAALISELQPRASLHRPTGQETHAQDNEIVVVADFGGLTVDIAGGRVSTQTDIPSVVWQGAPASRFCGASLLSDAFVKLLENKARMLLQKLPSSDWFHQALGRWQREIFPRLYLGSCYDLTFDVAQEDFKDSAKITHHRWAKDGKFPIHSVELESMMEFYMEQATAAIQDQINNLGKSNCTVNHLCLTGGFGQNKYVRSHVRQVAGTCGLHLLDHANITSSVQAVSRGAALYGLYLSPANRRSGPDGQNSDVIILIGHDRIILVHKGELMPRHTFKRIPIKGNLMRSCFQRETGSYKLNVYSTSPGGTLTSTACIIWQHFQREVMPNDVCVLEIRLHRELGDGSLMSLIYSAHVAVFVNGVRQGLAQLSHH
ncbi:hypothetical protein F4802DRAFT_610936 [Xylaria palmicola]|nr:hypothetical protein F4802DRAFT_610936 [Xylaria palmicola]